MSKSTLRLPPAVLAQQEASQAAVAALEQSERDTQAHNDALFAAQDGTPAPAPVEPVAPQAQEPVAPASADHAPDAPLPSVPITGDTVARGEYERMSQAYATLQGKYNSEVPRLQTENALIRNDLHVLGNQLAQLHAQPQAPASGTPAASPPQGRGALTLDDLGITAEQRDAIGDTGMEVISDLLLRGVNTAVNRAVAPLQEARAMDTRSRFNLDFVTAVPDYEAINANPRFQAFMNELEPLSGEKRGVLFQEAMADMNAFRAANFYRTFQASSGTQQAPPPAAPATRSMADRVAPGAGGSGAPPSPAQPKIYRRHVVAAFYQDAARGKFKGREEEYKQLDREYGEADKSGRVID